MSRPDLCFATSSFRKSLSRRWRFSIASSTVKRGRTPRNSATSPRHAFRSTTIVGRLVSRASSTPQFTATVVVPAPPLAPRNACVTHGGLAPAVAASRRVAVRRTAPWNDSSIAREAWVGSPPRPGEELVGAGAHRLENQIGLRRGGDRKDRQRSRSRPAAARWPPCPTRRQRGCRRRRGRAQPPRGCALRRCRPARRRRAAAARLAV